MRPGESGKPRKKSVKEQLGEFYCTKYWATKGIFKVVARIKKNHFCDKRESFCVEDILVPGLDSSAKDWLAKNSVKRGQNFVPSRKEACSRVASYARRQIDVLRQQIERLEKVVADAEAGQVKEYDGTEA